MENITITFTGKSIGEVAQNARAFINGMGESVPTTAPAKRGRGPAKKAKEETFGDDDTEIDMEMDTEETEIEEVEEDTEEMEESEITLKEVTAALKKFASRGEKFAAKAKDILKKYKVKHVDDLPTDSYSKVIEMLN